MFSTNKHPPTSCLLILSTLFGSTSRSLPTTTRTTFLEIWMMFAVMLTFAEVILQTIIGYKREQEKKFKHDVQKIAPRLSTTTTDTMSLQYDQQHHDERFNISSQWNLIFGRIMFPMIFISFTLIYSIIAISYIFSSNIDIENLQKC